MPKPSFFFILSAPSGTGKTSIALGALKLLPQLTRIITHTTRAPRYKVGEKHEVDYYFVSEEKFKQLKNSGYFIETTCNYGNYYGTSYSELERISNIGKNALLVIDTEGVKQIKTMNLPNTIFIFIRPPTFESLTRRLTNRGTENKNEMELRLKNYEYEISQIGLFDTVLINDDLDQTILEFAKIINGYVK